MRPPGWPELTLQGQAEKKRQNTSRCEEPALTGPLENGGFGWEISPIHESYDIQQVTKTKKGLVPSGNPIPHESSVYHQDLRSQTSNGCWGEFDFPFKLFLERF